MRKKIYQIVHVYGGNIFSVTYKYIMITAIALSLLPLTVKEDHSSFTVLECTCLGIFLIDYVLRWVSADYKFGNHTWTALQNTPSESFLLLICCRSWH